VNKVTFFQIGFGIGFLLGRIGLKKLLAAIGRQPRKRGPSEP
jgi:hypothetical protein